MLLDAAGDSPRAVLPSQIILRANSTLCANACNGILINTSCEIGEFYYLVKVE